MSDAHQDMSKLSFADPLHRRAYSPELRAAAEGYLIARFTGEGVDVPFDAELTKSAMLIVNGLSYWQPHDGQLKYIAKNGLLKIEMSDAE